MHGHLKLADLLTLFFVKNASLGGGRLLEITLLLVLKLVAHLLECVAIVALLLEGAARIQQLLHFGKIITIFATFLG